MTAYISAFRIRLIAQMQYRAAAWAGVATQFFFGFVFIMIYHAFYESSPGAAPMPMAELSSYLWLRQAFLAFIALWWQDGELLDSIASGNIAYELCRPYKLYAFWSARLLATRVGAVALRCVPLMCVTFFLPAGWKLGLPPSVPQLLLFIVSLICAAVMNVVLSMFIYIFTFYTLSPLGVRIAVCYIVDSLAGNIIPLPMLPANVAEVVSKLPFAYIGDFPFRVYSANIGINEAALGIGLCILWIVALGLIGWFALKRALKKVVIQGG